MRLQWRTKAGRWARQSVSSSVMALGMSACVQMFVNLTLRVTSSQSSDQQCNHVSFSESGHRSGSRSSVAGFDRSNCQTVSRAHERTAMEGD